MTHSMERHLKNHLKPWPFIIITISSPSLMQHHLFSTNSSLYTSILVSLGINRNIPPNFSYNITGVKFHPHYTNSKKNILSPYNFPFTFVYHLLQYLIYLWYTLFEWNIMICFEFLGIFRKIRNLLVEYVWWKINTYSKIYNIVLFTIFVLKFNKL